MSAAPSWPLPTTASASSARSRRDVFGATATRWRRFHASSTWAGVSPAPAATATTAGWASTSRLPWPSGVCAWSTTPWRAQKSTRPHCGSATWRSTWFTAGGTTATANNWRSAAIEKLHTPSETTSPSARAASIARHTSASAPFSRS